MKFANLHMYSDVRPYEVIRQISDKTMEVREMAAIIDPNFKPEIAPGGFAGHCVNQADQTYFYKSDDSQPVIRIRKRKDGKWYSKMGRHIIANAPRYFYDYNF